MAEGEAAACRSAIVFFFKHKFGAPPEESVLELLYDPPIHSAASLVTEHTPLVPTLVYIHRNPHLTRDKAC
jgi:hypothetical protein